MENSSGRSPHVVIVGAGFGGLRATQALARADVSVTVIDRSNHHLFQPLLYQVATATLSPAHIATPIRSVLRQQSNAEVLMAEVQGVDLDRKVVRTDAGERAFDFLVLATGARHAYFGNDEWEPYAPGLKSLADATTIRQKILTAFEKAETELDPQKRQSLLRFILVGGGPTGVEMAGAIAELAHRALASDFRRIDPAAAQILLVEAGPRILGTFPQTLSEKAKRSLERLGVKVLTNSRVEKIDGAGVWLAGKCLESTTVIWTAGVMASPAGKWLKADTDRAGRVKVGPDLSVPGRNNVFVIGDAAAALDAEGKLLPGVAPVAMQEGKYVARVIRGRLRGESNPAPFRYRDKGSLATVGRKAAVADLGKVRLSGLPAWVAWIVVHIYYLIGFRNRVVVMMEWGWAYLTFQRGARLIIPRAIAILFGL